VDTTVFCLAKAEIPLFATIKSSLDAFLEAEEILHLWYFANV
jgi:hypothetical protein